MIYDRDLSICTQGDGASPYSRRLAVRSTHLCAEKEVFHARYWEAMAAGDRIDLMLELPRDDDITADDWALYRAHVWRINQAQHGTDGDGLAITTLSLQRMEGNYDIIGP